MELTDEQIDEHLELLITYKRDANNAYADWMTACSNGRLVANLLTQHGEELRKRAMKIAYEKKGIDPKDLYIF